MTRVLCPARLDALWPALEQPGAMVLAGGTDLLVWRRAGRVAPAVLVSLERVEELRGLQAGPEDLVIGAMEPLSGLLRAAPVRERLPALASALRVLGSPLVRAAATLGGNLCSASPGGDSLPPLLVYQAELELVHAGGSRRLALADFLLGPGRTALAPGEILRSIRVPAAESFQWHHFEKVGRRAALTCALASLAALIRRDGDGRVLEARLAWGAVAATAFRCPAAEARLLGTRLEPAALRAAGLLAQRLAAPRSDLRAGAGHRAKLVANLLARLEAGQP
jgi:CO/xanthine dehydrogenase FAD-binding subunit